MEPYIEELSLAHLVTFDSSISSIDLTDFDIEYYDSWELSELFNIDEDSVEGGYFVSIEKYYPIKEHPENLDGFSFTVRFHHISEGVTSFQKPLIILNLFKQGRTPLVMGKCYFRRHNPKTGETATKILEPKTNFEMVFEVDENGNKIPRKWFIFEEEISNLKHFVKQLKPFISPHNLKPNLTFLQIAITFFQDGLQKEVDRNSYFFDIWMIYYVIGLEALYIKKRDQHLTRKLVKRIAELLAKSTSEKAQIQSFVKQLCKIRGNLVHGSSTVEKLRSGVWELESTNFETGFQCSVRELLRKSIVHFVSLLANGYEKRRILEMLDRANSDEHVRNQIAFMKNKLNFSVTRRNYSSKRGM
jgi:hypothetical protein